jgi:predicted small integral membrane protein
LEIELLFRESYIKAFSKDLRVAMYVAIAAFMVFLCVWQRHSPTVKERSELLAKAVVDYHNDLKAPKSRRLNV